MTVDGAYARFFPLLRRKCARMLGGGAVAEDLAQETFVRFWREGLADRDVRTVTAWLYRTATRLAVDHARASGRAERRHAFAVDAAARVPTPEATVHARRLLALVERLPAAELEAALLARVDGLTQPEIAEVLGVSERTVRRLVSRLDARLIELEEAP